jgi:hypothetical protein
MLKLFSKQNTQHHENYPYFAGNFGEVVNVELSMDRIVSKCVGMTLSVEVHLGTCSNIFF